MGQLYGELMPVHQRKVLAARSRTRLHDELIWGVCAVIECRGGGGGLVAYSRLILSRVSDSP